MKITCISDTHGYHKKLTLPPGDVLVHAGDWTQGRGSLRETEEFAEWFRDQKQFTHRIITPGNHDFTAEIFMSEGAELLLRDKIFRDCYYLRDAGVTLDGVSFYGMPWTPWFYDWAFNAYRGKDMQQHVDKIPTGTDVLVTHGPPWGILDNVAGKSQGCKDLLERLAYVRPSLHVFGHLHDGFGTKTVGETKFVNASVTTIVSQYDEMTKCEEFFYVQNRAPWEVTIERNDA